MRRQVESVLIDTIRYHSGVADIDLEKTAADYGLDSLDAIAVSADVFEQLRIDAEPSQFDVMFADKLSRVVDFLMRHVDS